MFEVDDAAMLLLFTSLYFEDLVVLTSHSIAL